MSLNLVQPLGLVPFHPTRFALDFWRTYKKVHMTFDAHEFRLFALFPASTKDTVLKHFCKALHMQRSFQAQCNTASRPEKRASLTLFFFFLASTANLSVSEL